MSAAEALAAATARYSTTADPRKLLTHDEERGGIADPLLSARWLLTYFQAADRTARAPSVARARAPGGVRVEARRARAHRAGGAHGQVEADGRGAMLAEVEERTRQHAGKEQEAHYMRKAESGEWRAVTKNGYGDRPVEIAFPSAMALSHMWLDKAHPDPNARNLRDMWLPAIEWLYSERVRAAEHAYGDEYRAKDADGTPLSDEAVLAAADFGLFVDLSSMCQKENDRRTEVEDGLFRHSLGSLDVVYAHKSLMSLLSTRVPEGVEVDRSYGERHSSLTPNHSTHLPISPFQTDDRGWTNFERAEGQLIKPDSFCVDIGLFTVEKAYAFRQGSTMLWGRRCKVRIGEVPFAKKSVKELAAQGSYDNSGDRGLLGSLVSSRRDAPLSPDAFATVLSKKEFTNGADSGTVINLYRNTATRPARQHAELRYEELEWSEAQFERLGEALCYCVALETLEVFDMEGLSDTAAAAVVAGLASCTSLQSSTLITALPDLSALTSLQTLDLRDCESLTALPDLSALTSLQTLNLDRCRSLTALPDLSALTSLQTLNLDLQIPHGAARPVGAHVLQRARLLQLGAARPLGVQRPQREVAA